MEMNTEVIVTCAVTGGGEKPKGHPAIPVTPAEIAASAIDAAKAGAAIVHIHVRDPATGRGVFDLTAFREVMDRIRSSDTDVVINLTGGSRGAMVMNDREPLKLLPGSDIERPEMRVEHAGALLPEICTLDCGSMNWGDSMIYAGHPSAMREMARLLQLWGVKPEIEAFDVGALILARKLIDEGFIDAPPLFQFCLGIGQNAPPTTAVMLAMRDLLPTGSVWAAFGIGRQQMPMVAKSVLMGGHVRVGLEDNIYLDRGVYASNAQLVERAVEIVERLGARIVTPTEARAKLGLKERER
jgi:uncharacterized protein (DUF849 family)